MFIWVRVVPDEGGHLNVSLGLVLTRNVEWFRGGREEILSFSK